jgi:hypothetical protein
MTGKHVRQRYFAQKEINISICLIVLWSFLAVALLMYLAKEIGGLVGNVGIMSFIVVMIGYAIVVAVLTIFFSSRLVGPFRRLNSEINGILADDMGKRLKVRLKDDLSVRTFISHVNNLLDEVEKNRRCNDELMGLVQSELSSAQTRLENGQLTEEEVKAFLSSLTQKASSLVEEIKRPS